MSSADRREELRRRAESRAAERIPGSSDPVNDTLDHTNLNHSDKDALIHELRVHQIELEIQNEELRRAQQELESSRNAYLHLYIHAPVGYLTMDKNGIIRRHNETLLEMIGDPDADLRGTPFSSLLTEESRALFLARLRSFFMQPQGKNMEARIRTASGKGQKYLDIRLSGRTTLCDGDGEHTCLLMAVTDISQQKESERWIQALLDEKSLLMQEVHHRVKNNLNTVLSMLNLQTVGADAGPATEAISAAANRVRTMYAIYELLQDAQDFQEVDLRDYLNVLLTRIIEGQSGASMPPVVRELASVPVTTRQAVSLGIILNELVADAWKHAFPDGSRDAHGNEGPRIIVGLAVANNGRLVLSVEDNGVGMDPGALAEKTTARGPGGFGLLLVRSQVEQLGGDFAIEDAHPGTRFSVTIPFG